MSAALVSLRDCPPGLFRFQGILGFKTEYGASVPRDAGGGKVEWTVSQWPDVYCVDSGETFWGGTSKQEDRAALMVEPISIEDQSPECPGIDLGNDPDLGKIDRDHVCKHGVRWPHPCQPCDDAAYSIAPQILSLDLASGSDITVVATKIETVAENDGVRSESVTIYLDAERQRIVVEGRDDAYGALQHISVPLEKSRDLATAIWAIADAAGAPE